MTVFAHVHGTEIHGQVMDEGEIAVANAKITAYSPAGQRLAEAVSDDKGEFRLTVTKRCDWRIVADAAGHRAECTVPASELPADLPEASNSDEHDETDGDLADLHRQVIALRRDVDRLQNKLRYQDIIGGVGYILGLIGITAYFLGGRRRKSVPDRKN